MNSNIKSLLWLIAAGTALYFGLRLSKQRDLEALQQDYNTLTARASELSRDVALTKEKLHNAQAESEIAGDFEARHNASLASIVAEQKKIENLLIKWPEVESDRAAAVKAVREKESTRPPSEVTLTDGTKLERFVVRGVPNEQTVAVEHASGVVKLTADNLPGEVKARLALGWIPVPPASVSVDKEGNAIVKQAVSQALSQEAAADLSKELNLSEKDNTTIVGVTRALANVESQLAKAEKAFEKERITIRQLGIFKSDARDGAGSSYGKLKQDANARLTSLARRIQALRGERSKLQHTLKSF